MARAARTTAADLKTWLLSEARSFAFFQAIRLFRLSAKAASGDRPFDWSSLRIRTNLSLAFPESDIESIEETDAGTRITANFFGLYGVASPLPTFYTEDLLDEAADDRSAQRDFLDIFHFALYPLIYDAWAKYRNSLKVIEERDSGYVDRMFSLVGFADESTRADLPNVHGLVRYAGLFTQYPRSALGLQTILSDAAGGSPVSVESCVPDRLRIPQDQRLTLGAQTAALGISTYLGQEMEDRMSTITIRIGPVDADTFHELLPYSPEHNRLRFLVRMYLIDPLRSKAELILAQGCVQGARLGGRVWNQLGLDTWSFAGDYDHEVRATFALYK